MCVSVDLMIHVMMCVRWGLQVRALIAIVIACVCVPNYEIHTNRARCCGGNGARKRAHSCGIDQSATAINPHSTGRIRARDYHTPREQPPEG